MGNSSAVIVVPCYNERERLPVGHFQHFVSPTTSRVKFLFVDDGSTDGTRELLEEVRDFAPDVFHVHCFPRNVGKSEAVRAGILKALETDARYVGFWDADLAAPLEEILLLCSLLDRKPDVDVVLGSRVQLLGRRIERRTVRRLLGRLFAMVASTMLGVRIYDTQCGAKLFRATSYLPLLFQEPFVSRWIFDVEIIARLARLRADSGSGSLERVVYEAPLDIWCDPGGSRLRWGNYALAVWEMLKIYRKYGWRRYV